MLVGGDGQRAKRASVKRLFERDDLGSRFPSRIPVPPCEFQAGLDRLGAAVAKKRAREAGQVRKAFGELTLERVIEQVRRVEQGLGLIGDCTGKARMRMA